MVVSVLSKHLIKGSGSTFIRCFLLLPLCLATVSSESSRLLLAEPSNLSYFNTSSRAFSLIPANLTGPIVDLDYHPGRRSVFWIDGTTHQILSHNLDTAATAVAVDYPGDWEPAGLAVDSIGEKVYVADELGRKVDVFDLDRFALGRALDSIVLGTGLQRPSGIALDSAAGLMFIIDSDRIIRADMDGKSVLPIIRKAIESSIFSLTLDTDSKTIFWWDSDLRTIESSSYIGSSRKIVHRTAPDSVVGSLAFLDQQIYYLDRRSRKLYSVEIEKRQDSGASETVILDDTAVVNLRSLSKPPTAENPCRQSNGGCQHTCLLTGRAGRLGSSCACATRHRLAGDGRSCSRARELLVYSQKEVIKARALDAEDEEVVLSIARPRGLSLSVDYDDERGVLYFTDANTNAIYASSLLTGKSSVVANYSGSASLSVDLGARNLYYTDFVAGELHVVSLKNLTSRKRLLDSLTEPRDILAHQGRGQVYFLDDGRVKRINADGSKFVSLYATDEGDYSKILKLSLDSAGERLYWLERSGSNLTVRSSDLDGGNVTILAAPFLPGDCTSLAVRGEWIYAVCENYERAVRVNRSTGRQMRDILRRDEQGFYALAVARGAKQPNATSDSPSHPCARQNGGCSHLCFGVPWSKGRTSSRLMRVCGCPAGLSLGLDRLGCLEEAASKARLVHRCEPDWEFACRNGRCVPRTQVCDGVNDCLDRSDERHCANRWNDFVGG